MWCYRFKGKQKESNSKELTEIPYGDCWNWERWYMEDCCGLFAIFCIEAEAGKRAAILNEESYPQYNAIEVIFTIKIHLPSF